MKILSPEEIKQPEAALVVEAPKPTDYVSDDPVLGADILGGVKWEILCPEKDWSPYITEMEVQTNGYFNSFSCVTQSTWNKIQILINKKYGITVDYSKRYTAVKSGTKPGVGNSVGAVVEHVRTKSCVPETIWPTMRPDMTQSLFFANIPAEIDKFLDFLNLFEYKHEWVNTYDGVHATKEVLSDHLQYSPIMVSVGPYYYDNNGALYSPTAPQYIHEVLLVKEDANFFYTLDSENGSGLMKYRKDYLFGYPKIGWVKKKIMVIPKIYKKVGSPALYALSPKGTLVPFYDGSVEGGLVFATLYGVGSPSQLSRVKNSQGEDWDTLPFPVAPWGITSFNP